MKSITITAPVLLIAFNRPDTTSKVFQKIRQAEPTKLYIAIDGARRNKTGEEKLVEQVKNITKNVDWECITYYKFNENNLGAEVTVSNAVTWALENEKYVIVLEDDIIAPFSFFRFAQEMLEKYHDNSQVSIVCGTNPLLKIKSENDYFFTRYGTSWGWATWKRAWNDYRLDEEISMEIVNKKRFPSRREYKYHVKLFYNLKSKGKGNINWDYMFYYYNIKNDFISIMPVVNLCSNIGVFGLHARGRNKTHFRPVDDKFIALKHPTSVEVDQKLNLYLFNKHRYPRFSLVKLLLRKLTLIISNSLLRR